MRQSSSVRGFVRFLSLSFLVDIGNTSTGVDPLASTLARCVALARSHFRNAASEPPHSFPFSELTHRATLYPTVGKVHSVTLGQGPSFCVEYIYFCSTRQSLAIGTASLGTTGDAQDDAIGDIQDDSIDGAPDGVVPLQSNLL